MEALSSERLEAVIASLPALYEPCSLGEFPQKMMAVLRRVIEVDGNAYNEVNPSLHRAFGVTDEPGWNMEALLEPFQAFMDEHPVINHCAETRDGSARKISDFMPQPQFIAGALYNEVYRHIDVKHQMAISIPSDGDVIVALLTHRSTTDFDEADRAVMNMMRPHFAQAYQAAVITSRLNGQLNQFVTLLERLGQGALIVDAKLKITLATPDARRTLTSFFGPQRRGGQLPTPLYDWLRQTLHRAEQTSAFFSPPQPLRVFANGRWLFVRFAGKSTDGTSTLFLQEQVSATTAEQKLRPLGFTPREAEILYWVAQGKTNPEIGIICGLSARTVQKHLEHVFQKLGVKTRTAAALRASELL